MRQFTTDDLFEVMRRAAGEVSVPVAEAQDRTFDDLGYDSLALLETAAQLQREYGFALDAGDVSPDVTPRELVGRLNATVGA